jgi:hypothetical protein
MHMSLPRWRLSLLTTTGTICRIRTTQRIGYAATGVDQPGWNADDIVRVLRELFPNRAWAVFDDRQYVLYLYNLTPDYVPDWLIEKLSPTAMKVLKAPADVSVAKAWLDALNERNAQIPAPAELP